MKPWEKNWAKTEEAEQPSGKPWEKNWATPEVSPGAISEEESGPMLTLDDGTKVPIMAGMPIGIMGTMAARSAGAVPGLLSNSLESAPALGGAPQEFLTYELENGATATLPKENLGLLKATAETAAPNIATKVTGGLLKKGIKAAIKSMPYGAGVYGAYEGVKGLFK